MSRQSAEQWTLVTAGVVIIALTGAAFWLSYAHLAEVAGQHGLGHSPARQWAWPATLDAAIVAGELLMLRAGLRKEVDWWAIALTAAGSVGSIALNIAGVSSTGQGGSVPVLDYVVAAVPPTAALLAFGVLMRQIHRLVAHPGDHIETPAVAPAPAAVLAMTTGTRGDPEQGTNTAAGPDHSTGPDDWSGGADQTSSSATNQPNTAAADHAPTGADHHRAPVPERTNPADQPGADQDRKAADQPNTGPDRQRTTAADQTEVADQPGADHGTDTLRTSITPGQAADQAADQRTTQPGRRNGSDADHRVSRSSRHRSAADQRPDQTDHKPADQPPADQDQKTADQPNTGPDHQRTTATDQTEVADQPGADHGTDTLRTSITPGQAADQA
ncbi:DUF2637 domain-containing protein, partial [Streptomyces tsukubensis]|uniref:DUF2637 domain-containing protein n=1 Tax=Streptomyces tsukubensis TaxID=83656 RepID=UPI003F4EE604